MNEYCIIKRRIKMNNKKKSWYENKWFRAAIPALLLHCSIGTVYCWSIFSQEIADYIGFSKGATEWAFSLAIFFLGMSAAFLGNVVEKDIHKSSLIATICFAAGMAGTGAFIYLLRRKKSRQYYRNYRNIFVLRCYYGYRFGYGLSFARKNSYALVCG